MFPGCLEEDVRQLLDVLEIAERALVDHFASEDGLDVETARLAAVLASEKLVKYGRKSVVVETAKQPEV